LYISRDNLDNVVLIDYDFGNFIVNNLNKDLGINKFYKTQSVRASDSGVLSRLNMPGILLEVGFICNEDDRNILLNRQQEIAQSIANSIDIFSSKIS